MLRVETTLLVGEQRWEHGLKGSMLLSKNAVWLGKGIVLLQSTKKLAACLSSAAHEAGHDRKAGGQADGH